MSMTEREKAARAIGYLEGMSSVIWSLDRNDLPVQVGDEAAVFYDQHVEVLRKMLFENESEGE